MLKIDMHVHSTYSGDALHSVEQLARAAKAKGLDGIAVCDHNKIAGDNFELRGFLIIRGMEYSSQEGHILLLGIPRKFRLPKHMHAAEVVKRVRQLGGISIVPHAYSVRKWKHSMHSKAFNVGATALERFNGSDFVHNLVAMQKIPWGTGGSDAHSAYEVGNAYTLVECARNEKAVLREIQEGMAGAVLAQKASTIIKRKMERFLGGKGARSKENG